MRKTSTKIMASLMIILFILQPILEVVFGLGKTQAFQPGDSITGTSHNEILGKLGPGQYCRIYEVKNKYRVHYRYLVILDNLWECYYNHYHVGDTIATNKSGVYAKITSIGRDFAGCGRHTKPDMDVHSRENYYTARICLELDYETPYMVWDGNLNSFPEIKASHGIGPYGRYAKIDQVLTPTSASVIGSQYTGRVETTSNGGNNQKRVEYEPEVKKVVDNTPQNTYFDNGGNSGGGGYTETICNEIVIDEPEVRDKWISVSNATKRSFIILLYKRMLNRGGNPPATESEIQSHMRGTVQEIAHNFVFSEEAATGWLSNEDFIDKLYRVFLNRGPDQDGMNAYLDMLSAPNRHLVVKSIVESDEFEQVLRNLDTHIDIDEQHQRLHIARLYRTFLGREPTDDEMRAHLKNYVQTNAKEIIFSEGANNHCGVNSMDNETFVKYLYRGILGREGEEKGVADNAAWLNAGNQRKDLVKAYVESQEFKDKCALPMKEISFDENMCNMVYNELRAANYNVYRVNNTTISMYDREYLDVKNLDLSGKGLKNLNGLSVFPNLETLTVHDNDFENIDEIKKMSKLKCLNIDGCYLGAKTQVVNNVTSLEELHMEKNSLDFYLLGNAISNLNNLKKLYISDNDIASIDAVFDLPKIKEIYADRNKIAYVYLNGHTFDAISLKENVSSISSYGKTKQLPNLYTNSAVPGSPLYTAEGFICEGCSVNGTNVELNEKEGSVTIKGGIADGSKLKLKNSQEVIIMNDKVLADRLQSKLGSMSKDRLDVNGKYYLYIDKNYTDTVKTLDLSVKEDDREEIRDITGLSQIKNLKSLNLNGNKVQNLNELKYLQDLETLSVRFNGLTSFDSLSELSQINQLDASNNSLTTTSGVESLTRLDTLILSNNNIGDNLDGIKGLNGLVTLAISNNNVHSLEQLSFCEIENIFASSNAIVNPSVVASKDSTKKLDLKNNIVDVEFNGSEGQIPDFISYVINATGLSGVELTNCKLEDNTIRLNAGAKVAQIKVKSGTASDTIVNIRNIEAAKPYDVDVSYKKNNDGSVTATIKSDVPIRYIASWDRNTDKTVYTKTYQYNVNENVSVTNENGEIAVKNIQINDANVDKIRGLRLSYDNYDETNGTVKMTITADEAMYLPPNWIGDGALQFNISEDQKTITKVFNVNGMRSVALVSQEVKDRMDSIRERYERGIMTEEDFNESWSSLNEKYIQVGTEVTNIDITAPECEVSYSTNEKTKGSVRATVWADEDIELVDKSNVMYAPVSKTNDNGKTVYGISLYFAENTEKDIEVQDSVGNKSTVHIAISNIDKYVDGLDVNTLVGLATNQSDKVVVKANETITISNEEGNIENVANFRINGFALPYSVSQIANDRNSGNTVSITRSEGGKGVVEADDSAHNTDVAPYNTNNIDKEAPVPGRYDTNNSDGSVTVELRFEEEIQETPELSGWEFSEDKRTIRKTFKYNGNEKIILKDLAGNENKYDVVVNSIDTIKYFIYYQRIDSSDRWVVTIEADRDIAEVNGWSYLENKRKIAKVFSTGEKETVIVNGLENGSTIANIEVNDVRAEEMEHKGEDYVPESTESNKILPKTGAGFGVAIFAIIAGFMALRSRIKLQRGPQRKKSRRK